MKNISSIYHFGFERLHEITKNYNKATLLDKLIYWWQISKYTLEDNKIWFTRSIDQIAFDSKLARRTVERYLHDFEKAGLIEKINKLFKKKHLYIRITDKLLSFLEISPHITSTNLLKTEKTDNNFLNKERLFLNQNGATDPAKMAVSIYKDKDINIPVNNNTVSQPSAVNNLKSTPQNNPQSIYPSYPIETLIGERLTLREKNYIKGMMHNLQKQHSLSFSAPEQLFAEIVFTLLNKEQLTGIDNFNHRIQIIAKLLRNKTWSTPKGFYNHADFGAFFRKNIPAADITNNTKQQGYPCNQLPKNKGQLEKEKEQLKNQFNEACLLSSTQINHFQETTQSLNEQSMPYTMPLVNAIVADVIKGYQQQNTLMEHMTILDQAIKKTMISPELHLFKTTGSKLNVLNAQDAQLTTLKNTLFDVYCNASAVAPKAPETDLLYQYYEELNQIKTYVRNQINDCEVILDYEYAA